MPLAAASARKRPLPAGLIFLALFSALLGAVGIWLAADEWFAAPGKEESPAAMLDRIAREAPPEYREQLKSLADNPELKRLVGESLQAASQLVPDRGVYQAAGLAISLLALAGGVGILMRRDRGRVAFIWMLVLATVSGIYFGFRMIPGAIGLISQIGGALGGAIHSRDTAKMEDNLYWIMGATSALFILLHGGIIYYLTRPKIKGLFE